jgi:hypothetical protein
VARFPHFKHRVVDQLFNEIDAHSHILKEPCEASEVPNVKLIHRPAITSGNECEECSFLNLGGLVVSGKAPNRAAVRGMCHGEFCCMVV